MNAKANENLDESYKKVETVESMNKNDVIHSCLIRCIAKLLVPKNKNQFRLLVDLDSDNWNGYIMHWEKVTIYDDTLLFRDTGLVFTSKRDSLKMITDYACNKQIYVMRNNFLFFMMKFILICMQKLKALQIQTS